VRLRTVRPCRISRTERAALRLSPMHDQAAKLQEGCGLKHALKAIAKKD
jgi:hypothetical protein